MKSLQEQKRFAKINLVFLYDGHDSSSYHIISLIISNIDRQKYGDEVVGFSCFLATFKAFCYVAHIPFKSLEKCNGVKIIF